jgi:hypothetical protein
MERSEEVKNMEQEDTSLTEKRVRELQRLKDKEMSKELSRRLAEQRLLDVRYARERKAQLRKARRSLRES